jgi:hypothetical protein
MTTEAPILIFFTTNCMGTGYVATPSTRAVNGGVIREKPEESAGHPPALRRLAARLDAKRLHSDVARRFSAAFPSVIRGRFLAAKIGAKFPSVQLWWHLPGAEACVGLQPSHRCRGTARSAAHPADNASPRFGDRLMQTRPTGLTHNWMLGAPGFPGSYQTNRYSYSAI